MQSTNSAMPSFSNKIQRTLDPCVVLMKEMIGQYSDQWRDKGGIYSLAQGVVYWQPPPTATEALQNAIQSDSTLHMYGPDEGMSELRTALEDKVREENGLTNHDILVTVGANQAYVNCVLTLLHEGQRAVVFAPYYFNHVMALQMTLSNKEDLVVGPTINGRPDLDWLEQQLRSDKENRIQTVTIVNPGNPTGSYLEKSYLQRAVDLCKQHSCWLVLDCTYEYFVYDTRQPDKSPVALDACFDEPHVVHIFSFSKSYALAGYRCGYVALHREAADLYNQMLKVQDTVPIAPSRIAQVAAMGALKAGPDWVRQQYSTLSSGRKAILNALEPLDEIVGGTGAMYVMGKLPAEHCNDEQVARDMVQHHGVAVIPGSFCGFPGWIRICYANLPPEECAKAAQRLETGLHELTSPNGRFRN